MSAQNMPLPDDEKALDLHDVYNQNSECGFPKELLLSHGSAALIAARLRGINAVSAVLIAGNARDNLDLSDWMRGGLIEAIHALAEDAYGALEHDKELAQKGKQ
ncbi:hypothetical protein D3C72_831180 [compost metagenome]